MNSLTTLVQALGVAYASGISPYATVALAGIAARLGWIDSLPGTLGLATHATKLGLRYTIDTSPEPITNGAANIAELGAVATLAYAIWHHPYITLTIALLVLVLLMILVRRIWRAARRALRSVFS